MSTKTAANLYVWLWMVYLALMAILGRSSIGAIELIIMAWSSYYFVKVLADKRPKPRFIYALTLLLLLFLVYAIMAVSEGRDYWYISHNKHITGFIYIRKIVLSLLPIFAFYYLSLKGAITKESLVGKIWLLLVLIVIGTISAQMMTLQKHEGDEGTVNYGYVILTFLPLLTFYRNRTLRQSVVYIFCLLLILVCMKRGAIMISIVNTFVFYFYAFRDSKKGMSYKFVFYLAMVLAVGYFAVNELLESSMYFQERLDQTLEGDSSGRDSFYEFFWDYFINNTSQHEFWFGGGAFTTLFIWGNYAHNDWLEIAINQGMFGVILFLYFTITFCLLCFKRQDDIQVKAALLMLFLIFFMRTIFSMSYDQFTLYYNILLGYCLAQTSSATLKVRVHKLKTN